MPLAPRGEEAFSPAGAACLGELAANGAGLVEWGAERLRETPPAQRPEPRSSGAPGTRLLATLCARWAARAARARQRSRPRSRHADGRSWTRTRDLVLIRDAL